MKIVFNNKSLCWEPCHYEYFGFNESDTDNIHSFLLFGQKTCRVFRIYGVDISVMDGVLHQIANTIFSMALCNILKLKGTIFVVDVELIILIWPLHYHLKRLWPKLPTCVCWLLPFFPLLPNIWPLSICSKASIFSPLKKYTYVIC